MNHVPMNAKCRGNTGGGCAPAGADDLLAPASDPQMLDLIVFRNPSEKAFFVLTYPVSVH